MSQQSELKAENRALRCENDALKSRIETLELGLVVMRDNLEAVNQIKVLADHMLSRNSGRPVSLPRPDTKE